MALRQNCDPWKRVRMFVQKMQAEISKPAVFSEETQSTVYVINPSGQIHSSCRYLIKIYTFYLFFSLWTGKHGMAIRQHYITLWEFQTRRRRKENASEPWFCCIYVLIFRGANIYHFAITFTIFDPLLSQYKRRPKLCFSAVLRLNNKQIKFPWQKSQFPEEERTWED